MQRRGFFASAAPQSAGHVMQCALEGVRVVLVSPQHAGNVGSVCRVAANFDCNDLWLVNPSCDYKGVEAHTMAANSSSQAKLEHIHVVDTLGEALQNCSMLTQQG